MSKEATNEGGYQVGMLVDGRPVRSLELAQQVQVAFEGFVADVEEVDGPSGIWLISLPAKSSRELLDKGNLEEERKLPDGRLARIWAEFP